MEFQQLKLAPSVNTSTYQTIAQAIGKLNKPEGAIYVQIDSQLPSTRFDNKILHVRPVRWSSSNTLVALVDREYALDDVTGEVLAFNSGGRTQDFPLHKIADARLWPEYNCSECGDLFPTAAPSRCHNPICGSCRLGKRSVDTPEPPAKWPVYSCISCCQRYPSKRPFLGSSQKRKCTSCRVKSAKAVRPQKSTRQLSQQALTAGNIVYLQDDRLWQGTDGYGHDGWQCTVIEDRGAMVQVRCALDSQQYTENKNKIIAVAGTYSRTAWQAQPQSSAWQAQPQNQTAVVLAPHCPHRTSKRHTCTQHCIDAHEWETPSAQALMGCFMSSATVPETATSKTKTKKAVNMFIGMGYEREIISEMLELAGGNVDATAELLLGQAQATFKWQEGLDTLQGLGFDDDCLCRQLLLGHGGNWKACVKDLMAIERG